MQVVNLKGMEMNMYACAAWLLVSGGEYEVIPWYNTKPYPSGSELTTFGLIVFHEETEIAKFLVNLLPRNQYRQNIPVPAGLQSLVTAGHFLVIFSP